MRLILALWFIPLALFWGWYALSVNDINFGFVMLSRELHDVVFEMYARTLGVERDLIPGMIAGACALDTALIMAIAAFRWRGSWMPQAKELFGTYWHEDKAESTANDEFGAFKAAPSSRVHPAE